MSHAHFSKSWSSCQWRTVGEPGSEIVGRLQNSLYGTSDAAVNFQREFKKLMREQGFVVGAYNVSTSYHRQHGLRVMVHGDDFISITIRESLSWMKCRLEDRSVVKTAFFGHREGEALEGRVLNRVIRACSAGWEYEGDQRHAELVVGVMDLKTANSSHHTSGRHEGGGGGGESAVGGEQGHNVQAASRSRKQHGDG